MSSVDVRANAAHGTHECLERNGTHCSALQRARLAACDIAARCSALECLAGALIDVGITGGSDDSQCNALQCGPGIGLRANALGWLQRTAVRWSALARVSLFPDASAA